MATPELPEPMNSSTHHSKVRITTTLSDPTFVAGNFVSGKLDMECRADKGLGIGILMVELFAIQELSSREHSATSTFLHSRSLFQGPGLPPSNAVQAHILPGDPLLPQHYYQARRGKSTFLFRIPVPASSPSSTSFASGLAKVRYELRASVGVYWKNEKKLVVVNRTVDVVQAYSYEGSFRGPPEATVVGDNGTLWIQGRMVGGPVIAGGSACLELQVKNHSNRKNSSLTLTLTRTLYLPGQQQQSGAVQISDTLTTVPFRGPEYIIPPGAEGVASLAFDVPKHARGVQGGVLDGESEEDGGQPRRTESLFEIRCKVQVKLGMGFGSKDIILEIPIDVVHPMAQPIPDPFIQQQQPAPYTYANHAPIPEHTLYSDYESYYPNQPAYIDSTQIQPWLQPIEPPLLLPLGYPHGYPNPPGPPLLPPFQPFHSMQELTGGHTPPPHSFFPEAVPGLSPTLPYLPSAPYQTEPFQPVFMHAVPPAVTMAPQTDDFVGQIPIPIPIPSSPAANAMVHSPRPQLTPKHSFTRDPVFGSLTISKSERVEELEKMADEVAMRNWDLSGDLPRAADIGELDEKINGDQFLNLNKTLPGPPVPSDKFGGRERMEGWDNDVISNWEEENQDVEEFQQREGRSMSVFPADYQAVQSQHYPPQAQQQQPHVGGGFTYQTPPTPTLMAVLGPPKQTLASESGLDALERRLLAAEVGSRKHLEPWDNNTHHIIITEEEDEENVENGRTRGGGMKIKDQLGKRDGGDVLLSSSSPAVAGERATGVVNGNQRLPPIDTDLDLDLVEREGVDSGGSGGGGGNGVSAPIAIPMKSPDPLNESCISSLTLGGEGLVSGLPDTGGPSNGAGGGAAPVVAGDYSDGEGDGEAEFDGRTHRAGSGSISGGSKCSSVEMVPGGGGGGDGFHKHTRQRAEVSTPTEMIPQRRGKSRRGGSGRGSGGGGGGRVETKERVKASSSKKKERLTGTGKGTTGEQPKKSRNKSSAAAKGRVAAWLGGIDSAVPPQEEIIPPSPSVVKDLDRLSFEDEQRVAIGSLARSPLAAAAPLFPLHLPDSSDSQTTPGGALAFNARSNDNGGDDENNNMDQDQVISASPNPRSSGFVPITTLNRNSISLPSVGGLVRRPLLLSQDATVIEETRRVQDLWSSTPPGITPLDKDNTLKPGGTTGVMSLLPHEKVIRKPSPSSSFSKPAASVIPLSYSAAVTSAPPSAPASFSGATGTPRNVWKNADQTQQSTSQPKGRQVPPSMTKPPGYKPPSRMFPPPSKPPIDPEVEYDIRSARGGRGGKVSSVASLWASGAINTNQQRHNHHQTAAAAATTATAAAASHSNVKDKVKEVPKRLFNAVEEASSDTLPSSSSAALSKPVKTPKKKLFSAAVMTPAPALKNVRTYTSPTVASGSGGGGGGGSGAPKKMASTPAFPVRSVDVLGEKAAAATSRPIDNVPAERPAITTTTTMMNVFQGGGNNKTTPSANLSTSSSGPPPGGGGGKLHELTTTKRAAVNGPPGVLIKATSDPAVISSSHAVPTLSSTASLVRPHDHKTSTGRHLQPRVAVVKLPSSTTPGSKSGSGSNVYRRLGSSLSQVALVDNDNNKSNPRKPPAELAFGHARLRDLIKKYQGSSPG